MDSLPITIDTLIIARRCVVQFVNNHNFLQIETKFRSQNCNKFGNFLIRSLFIKGLRVLMSAFLKFNPHSGARGEYGIILLIKTDTSPAPDRLKRWE